MRPRRTLRCRRPPLKQQFIRVKTISAFSIRHKNEYPEFLIEQKQPNVRTFFEIPFSKINYKISGKPSAQTKCTILEPSKKSSNEGDISPSNVATTRLIIGLQFEDNPSRVCCYFCFCFQRNRNDYNCNDIFSQHISLSTL